MSTEKYPITDVTVRLIGIDSNAHALLGKVRQSLKKAGYDSEFIKKFTDEATSGNYNDLLCCIMKYVNVE